MYAYLGLSLFFSMSSYLYMGLSLFMSITGKNNVHFPTGRLLDVNPNSSISFVGGVCKVFT